MSLRLFLQDFHPLRDSNGTEDWVPVLGIFMLRFHYARGSRGSPFGSSPFDIFPLYSWHFVSRGAILLMLLRFTRRRRSND